MLVCRIIFVAWLFLALGISMAEHGKPKTGYTSFWGSARERRTSASFAVGRRFLRMSKTNTEAIDRLYKVRDALDFQLRFAEMANTKNLIIDKEDGGGYLFQVLIEMQIKKMEGDAE